MRIPVMAKDYMKVSKGLSAQAWPVSHGHTLKVANSRRQSLEKATNYNYQSDDQKIRPCIYDSTTYFIRDENTQMEVLMWGDVEPDSISLYGRNAAVWNECARKVVQGKLRCIFIECSFDELHSDQFLFGHLSPIHLIDELSTLATMVEKLQKDSCCWETKTEILQQKADSESYPACLTLQGDESIQQSLKRKRQSVGYFSEDPEIHCRRTSNPHRPAEGSIYEKAMTDVEEATNTEEADEIPSPTSQHGSAPRSRNTAEGQYGIEKDLDGPVKEKDNMNMQLELELTIGPLSPSESSDATGDYRNPNSKKQDDDSHDDSIKQDHGTENGPLVGVVVVITHVKERFEDEFDEKANILASLMRLGAEKQLGCTFIMANNGDSFYF